MIFSAIFFLAFVIGCREEGELIPDFNTSGIDVHELSIDVTSSTVLGDTVRTDRVSRMLLGKLYDKTFGLSTAEYYTQLMLSTSSFNVPDDIDEFDSLILYLAYDDFYGFFDDPHSGFVEGQRVNIYELSEDLVSDKEYYSNATASFKNEIIGTANLVVSDADVLAADRNKNPTLRIRINDEIKDRIFTEQAFSKNDDWLEFFKGIKVSISQNSDPTEDGSGALAYFDLLADESRMELYYTSDSKTESYEFAIDGEAQRFSNLYNNYENASVFEKIGIKDKEINYLSSLGGLRTEFTFKIPEELLEQVPISINKAELVIPYDEPLFPEYDASSRLVIIQKDESDNWVLPIDWFKGGPDYFGGSLDAVNKEYRFNLSSTLHEVINNGDTELKMYISISGNSVTGNRMKLFSGVGTTKKIYLILTYSKT